MKWVKRYMLNVRLKSLRKVLANAEQEGWPTVEVEARRHINTVRARLSELDAD